MDEWQYKAIRATEPNPDRAHDVVLVAVREAGAEVAVRAPDAELVEEYPAAAVDAFTMTSMSRLASCPLEEILLNDEQFSDLFDGYFTAHLADGRLVELVPNGARCVRNRRILACYTIGVIPLFFKSMLGCCLHNSPHSTSALTRTCCIPTPLHCNL